MIDWYYKRLGECGPHIKFEITPALKSKKVTMWFYGKCFKETTENDDIDEAMELAEKMLKSKIKEINELC